MTDTLSTKIAVIGTELENLTKTVESHIEDDKNLAKDIKEIKDGLNAINLGLARYKGILGACIVFGSAIWAFFVLFKDSLITWFKAVLK